MAIRQVDQPQIPAGTVDQGADCGPAEPADDQIAFPVADAQAQVSIGGLKGLSTDLVADGTQPCTFEEGLAPSTPILIGSGVSQVHHVVAEGLTMRLIVLDWQDRNVTIEITSIDKDLPATEYHAIAEPIIRSMSLEGR